MVNWLLCLILSFAICQYDLWISPAECVTRLFIPPSSLPFSSVHRWISLPCLSCIRSYMAVVWPVKCEQRIISQKFFPTQPLERNIPGDSGRTWLEMVQLLALWGMKWLWTKAFYCCATSKDHQASMVEPSWTWVCYNTSVCSIISKFLWGITTI